MTTNATTKAERKATLELARQFARDILLAEGFYTRAAVAVANQFLEADAEREDLRAHNSKLVAALVELVERAEHEGDINGLPEYDQARAALAKAKG